MVAAKASAALPSLDVACRRSEVSRSGGRPVCIHGSPSNESAAGDAIGGVHR